MDKKLADYLWGARWGVKAGKLDFAYAELSNALVYIGAEKETSTQIPQPGLPEGIFEPTFVMVPGIKFDKQGKYQTSNGMFDGIVCHYSVSGNSPSSARSMLEYLQGKGLGCMAMDADGTIYMPEGWDFWTEWDDHCGTSRWGDRTQCSKYFAGMEILCWGKDSRIGPFREVTRAQGYVVAGKYQQFTADQEKHFLNFCRWVKVKNPNFKFENVVGHDELRAQAGKLGDKSDPGGSFSMPMPKVREYLFNTK